MEHKGTEEKRFRFVCYTLLARTVYVQRNFSKHLMTFKYMQVHRDRIYNLKNSVSKSPIDRGKFRAVAALRWPFALPKLFIKERIIALFLVYIYRK
jgi:hypothetical protein